MEGKCMVYAGGYCGAQEEGIHVYQANLETGELAGICAGSGVSNPSYLAASSDGNLLYTVMEDMTYEGRTGGGVAAFRWENGVLRPVNSRGTGGTLPCHILLDEKRGYLFAANYMSGSISMFHVENDGSIGPLCDFVQHEGSGLNKERQEGPHVHFIGFTQDRSGIWCVDLGLDRIKYYEIDSRASRLVPRQERDIEFPPGSGPRHFVRDLYHRDILYVVCELSSEVMAVDSGEGRNMGRSAILQRISTLPEGVSDSTCAAIKMSEDGAFLYASNRGDDSIAVFSIDRKRPRLDLVEIVKAEGITPRDIWLRGECLLAANQDSDCIAAFHRDMANGRLRYTGNVTECRAPVCLI